jgi:anti-anti-sigma factor
MTIHSRESPDGHRVTIEVKGRFDFETHQTFGRVYRQYARGEKIYVVDLGGADYMDSSALGMLLQLRDHSDKARGGVVLANGNQGIREVLRIANFDKLFQIV